MIKSILFVCLGNICRSPMAQFMFEELLRTRGLDRVITVDSAGTSGEEAGNNTDARALRELRRHGINVSGKTARRMTAHDVDSFDLIVAMEQSNLRDIVRRFPEASGKTVLLMQYTGHTRDVDDPWYSGDFSGCARDIAEGLDALLAHLIGPNDSVKGK